jgi:glycerol-3-phosphate acyltransferase PlsY
MGLELPRRLFHMLGGLSVALSGLVLPEQIFIPSLIAATAGFVGLDIARFFSRRVNRWFLSVFHAMMRENESARITGSSYLALGALASFILFETPVAAMSLCFLATGDPVSGMVGGKRQKRRTTIRSLTGGAACFGACLAVAGAFHLSTGVPLAPAATGALFAAIAESLPIPLDDNLTIPLAGGLAVEAARILLAI